ncbi:MAG: gamma-glutamyl-gamma-aminobutyrate hydrolase family protein [Ilumatobacteraceae bacterium]
MACSRQADCHSTCHSDAGPLDLLDHVDGLVLTGGADIDPSLWGAPSETDEFPPEASRDRFELALAREAAARSLPVLGICRGCSCSTSATAGAFTSTYRRMRASTGGRPRWHTS